VRTFTTVILLIFIAGCGPRGMDPREAGRVFPQALYLSWQRDPATTMTIHWHGLERGAPSVVEYRVRGEEGWRSREGASDRLRYSDRWVHVVELVGLEPDSEYEFRLTGHEEVYWFRTMPREVQGEMPGEVRFVVGGDIYGDDEATAAMHRQAAGLDPMFIVFGGDIAYANASPRRLERWYDFFDLWQEHLVAPDGRQIPVLMAIGNHETRRELRVFKVSPFFPNLFALPGGRTYYALDFGQYMSVIVLDTGHLARVGGRQTRWLERTLERRGEVHHIFPVYHVPAYPSVRHIDAPVSRQVRAHWVPLFERAGVRFAFEHHDHAYKRTPPIRAGRVDPEGTVYIGDGGWGTGVRPTKDAAEVWYLERAEAVRHCILVEVRGEEVTITALEADGTVIDRYSSVGTTKTQKHEENIGVN
jgi:acid phosphatase type 7